jgi:hypothetical protein
MGPIAAIKLLPKVRAVAKSAEAFIHATPKDRDEAGADLAAAVLPVIEGFVGRDLVDDAAVVTATGDVLRAVESLLVVVRDVKAKQVP